MALPLVSLRLRHDEVFIVGRRLEKLQQTADDVNAELKAGSKTGQIIPSVVTLVNAHSRI